MVPAIIKFAHAQGYPTPTMPKTPNGAITGEQALKIAQEFSNEMFPGLARKA
jgi:phospholipase C